MYLLLCDQYYSEDDQSWECAHKLCGWCVCMCLLLHKTEFPFALLMRPCTFIRVESTMGNILSWRILLEDHSLRCYRGPMLYFIYCSNTVIISHLSALFSWLRESVIYGDVSWKHSHEWICISLMDEMIGCLLWCSAGVLSSRLLRLYPCAVSWFLRSTRLCVLYCPLNKENVVVSFYLCI